MALALPATPLRPRPCAVAQLQAPLPRSAAASPSGCGSPISVAAHTHSLLSCATSCRYRRADGPEMRRFGFEPLAAYRLRAPTWRGPIPPLLPGQGGIRNLPEQSLGLLSQSIQEQSLGLLPRVIPGTGLGLLKSLKKNSPQSHGLVLGLVPRGHGTADCSPRAVSRTAPQ